MFIRVEIAVIPYKLISRSLRSTHFFDGDLIDIWRTRNPDSTLFTWRQKKPIIQRRLDFWLISDFCQDEVEGNEH